MTRDKLSACVMTVVKLVVKIHYALVTHCNKQRLLDRAKVNRL